MQRIDYLGRRLQHPAARLRAQGEQVAQLGRRLQRAWSGLVIGGQSELEALRARWLRALRAPPAQSRALADAQVRLGQAWDTGHALRERRMERCALALRHLNPEAVLERGYAIVTAADERVVQRSAALQIGDALQIRFAQGSAQASVTARD